MSGKTGFFETLAKGVNELTASMSEVVGRVKEAATEVHRGAEEISSGNANLSQRTEQQSSSLEETASSMEEMTSTVKQNADNAAQANQLASAARRVALPRAAVRAVDGKDIVFVVRDARVERRAIRVGAASGEDVLVLSGVTAGESVVVGGPEDLADGDRVTVRSSS